MPAFLIPILNWIFRAVIVKFVVMAVVFVGVTVLLPMMLDLVAPFLGAASLTSAFSALPPTVWFFLDVARLDVGIPAMLSVGVTLFILRRVPFLNVK